MADAYEALDSLRALIKARREEEKEHLARGRRSSSESRVDKAVGMCEAYLEVMDLITKQIRSASGDIDDEAKPSR